MSNKHSNPHDKDLSNYKGVIITKKGTFDSSHCRNRILDSNGRMKTIYEFNEPKDIGNYKDFVETKTGIYGSEAKIKEFFRGPTKMNKK